MAAALVYGSRHKRIANLGCSVHTIRRRVQEWTTAGPAARLHTLVLAQHDRLIGPDLRHLCVDGCNTNAPEGGTHARRSPVDRGNQGRIRSLLKDATGVTLHLAVTVANESGSVLPRAKLTELLTLGTVPSALPLHLNRRHAVPPVLVVLVDPKGCVNVLRPKGSRLLRTSVKAGSWNTPTVGSTPSAICDAIPNGQPARPFASQLAPLAVTCERPFYRTFLQQLGGDLSRNQCADRDGGNQWYSR